MNEQLTEVESAPAAPPTGLQVPFDTVLAEIVKRVQSPVILGAMGFVALLFAGLFLVPGVLDKAPALPWGVLGFGLIVLLLVVVPQAYFQAREQARQEWLERDKARRLEEAARARRKSAAAVHHPAETPAPVKAPPPAETPSPTPPSSPRDADTLRELYLRELFADCLQLQLTTIDIRTVTGGREAAELELAAVFTDLDVIERSRESPHPLAPSPKDRERGESEAETRLPALAALSRYPCLVLLGDPGAGKSTLVNFIALCLAGDGLAHSEINLKRLGEAWTLPRPLPVRIILRDYAARGLPQGHSLYQFLQNELAARCFSDGSTLADCAAVVERALKRENGALLMLDGVDEVPDAHENRRRLQLKAAVERFARDFPHCRILVTSRPYAYQDPEAQLSGFQVRNLADFTLDEQVPAFIDRWYAHVGQKDRALGSEKAARYAEQLKATIERNPRLAELSSRPLLLTLMASLHRWREGGSLPEKRQELYEASVTLLLDLWQRNKPRYDAQGCPMGEEYDVWTELGIRADDLRTALNLVAYEAHRDQPTLQGTHDIRARDLAGVLYELSDKAKTGPDADRGQRRIIAYLTYRAGLLIERAQASVYTFPHRTFQEYLAACHLADEDFPFLLAEQLRQDDERWREAVLLAAAKTVSGSKSAVWNLVGGFCPDDYPPPEPPTDPDWTTALRAAQALVETEGYANVPDRQRGLMERLRSWLVALVEGGHLPPPERAAAGNALAVLDDPRPGVGVLSPSPDFGERGPGGEGLPDVLWCYVPQGSFLMGSSPEDVAWLERETRYSWNEETPHHPRDVPYDYWMARYPVTNGQFALFVRDPQGYADPGNRWWTRSGLAWRGDRREPEKYGGVFDLPNHPVVGVTWYEAVAYCAWLTEKLRIAHTSTGLSTSSEWANMEWRVRLPTEAEWEKAARGGLEIPQAPIIVDTPQFPIPNPQSQIPNPRPARRYPWGETPELDTRDPDRANYDESGVGATSAVGAFPGGVSPYGCLDLSGNVWEWCRTKWVDNYENYDKIKEREALEGDDTRVLRGGSWRVGWSRVRCAGRDWGDPHDRNYDWGFRVCVSTSSLMS